VARIIAGEHCIAAYNKGTEVSLKYGNIKLNEGKSRNGSPNRVK